MGESQVLANQRMNEMGARFTHLTTITEEMSSSMGILMNKLDLGKEKITDTETSCVDGGKNLNQTPHNALLRNTPGEGGGSNHNIVHPEVVRSLQLPTREALNPNLNWVVNPLHNQTLIPPGFTVPLYNQTMGFNNPTDVLNRPFPRGGHPNPQTQTQPYQPTPIQNQNPFPGPQQIPNFGPTNQNWSQMGEQSYNRMSSVFGPFMVPKMDFPRFEGKDPRGWVDQQV